MISHAYPNFNGGLAKPPLKFDMDKDSQPTENYGCNYLSMQVNLC